jgi:glycosyltransferase involved in cell wall biosynthesis
MKVSVVIPTYNRAEMLDSTLNSLVHQTFDIEQYEVIVVDDGSFDHTKAVCQNYKNMPNLSYLFQDDEGYRVSLARNKGIEVAKGEIIVFLDSGMVVGSNFVAAHHNEHGDQAVAVIGYVFGYDQSLEENGLPAYVNVWEPDKTISTLMSNNHLLDVREHVYRGIADDLMSIPSPWTLFWTTNVSVPASAIKEFGKFDTDFKTWGIEDVEFAYRMFKGGLSFKLSRDACGFHFPHKRDRTSNKLSNANNKLLFYKKHRNDEIELYTKSSAMSFNFDLLDFDNKKIKSEIFFSNKLSNEDNELIKKMIGDDSSVLFGSQDAHIVELCNWKVILEPNKNRFQQLSATYSKIAFKNQYGIATEFSNEEFSSCLIYGSIVSESLIFVERIIAEARRIAKKVFLVASCDLNVKATRHKITAAHKLSCDAYLYEF